MKVSPTFPDAEISTDRQMKEIVNAALARSGGELGRTADRIQTVLADLSEADRDIVARVKPFNMTSLVCREPEILHRVDDTARLLVKCVAT